MYMGVILHYSSTYPHKIWWAHREMIGDNYCWFRICCFLSWCSTFKPKAASSNAGRPKDDLPHPYLRKCFSVTVQPTLTQFGVNIVR